MQEPAWGHAILHRRTISDQKRKQACGGQEESHLAWQEQGGPAKQLGRHADTQEKEQAG